MILIYRRSRLVVLMLDKLLMVAVGVMMAGGGFAEAGEGPLFVYPREYGRLENNEKIVGEGGRLVVVEDAEGEEIEVVEYQPSRALQRERAISLFTTVKPKEPQPKQLERKYLTWVGAGLQEQVFKENDEIDRTIYRRGSAAHDGRIAALYETALLNSSLAKLGWALDQLLAAKTIEPAQLPPAAAIVQQGQRDYGKLREWLLARQGDWLATRGLIENVAQFNDQTAEVAARKEELTAAQKHQQAKAAALAEAEKAVAGRTLPKGDPALRRRDVLQLEEYEARADVLWLEQRIAQLETHITTAAVFVAGQFAQELGLAPQQIETDFATLTPEQIATLLELLHDQERQRQKLVADFPEVSTIIEQAAAETASLIEAAKQHEQAGEEPLKSFLAQVAKAYEAAAPAEELKEQLENWRRAVETLPAVDFGRYRIVLSSQVAGIPNCLGTPVIVTIGGVTRTFYSYHWPDSDELFDLTFDIEFRENEEQTIPPGRPDPRGNINGYCPNLESYNETRLKGWSFQNATTLTRLATRMFADPQVSPSEVAQRFVRGQYSSQGTFDVTIQLGRTKRHGEERGMGSPDASLDAITLDRIQIERVAEPSLVLRQVMVQKNLVKPGQDNRALAWIHNRTDQPQTGELKVFSMHGFNEHQLLTKQDVTLAPHTFAHLVIPVPVAADAPLFGHEVRMQLTCDDGQTVAADMYAVHTNCFQVFMFGGAMADAVYRVEKSYSNHIENFGVTFNDSVEVLPDNKLLPYVRGMPTAPALGHIPLCRAEVQRNRELGVASVHYISPLCTGHRSYYHYLRHPEWWPARLAWTDQMNDNYLGGAKLIEDAYRAGQPIDGDAIRKQFPMLHLEQPINHAHQELFDNLVEDLITFKSLVGWDGARWDGGPMTVFTRDFLGRPVKHPQTGQPLESTADVRQIAADRFKELKTRVRKHHPDWVYGNNGDFEGYGGLLLTLEHEAPDSKDFPHYREFMAGGGSYMDEGWMNAYIYADSRNRVEDYLKIGFKQSMTMKVHGGILQTFSPAREGTPSFHVDKIYFTLLPHLCGATYFGQLTADPWSEDGPARFFTRFGEFFFDPAIRPYPDAEERVVVDASDVWSHEAATWKQLSDDHVQVIVPIINKHPRDRLYDSLNRYSELPVPIEDDFAVTVAAPEGFENVAPQVWRLTCEPRTRAARLAAEASDGQVEVQVPGLQLFSVLVFDFQRSRE